MSHPRTPESAPDPASGRPTRSRRLIFVILCIACLLVAGGYAAFAWQRADSQARRTSAGPAADPAEIRAVQAQPHLVFRSLTPDSFGSIALTPLAEPGAVRVRTGLSCHRVHVAAGRGICLEVEDAALFDTYRGSIFDANFQVLHSFPLGGLPSRARVSPDGRYAATTVFVNGDSYDEAGFSTRTHLIDVATGATIAELEQFAVSRAGARFQAMDFNFWGITFARDSNRFYATLASGGKTYLIEGNVAAREARVLRENVECPSLSPDNTKLAFKKDMGDRVWRFHVLDLATLAETPLAETRSIDDQIEWLDDGHVVYGFIESQGLPEHAANVWVVPIDGSAPPRVLASGALSPAVVR